MPIEGLPPISVTITRPDSLFERAKFSNITAPEPLEETMVKRSKKALQDELVDRSNRGEAFTKTPATTPPPGTNTDNGKLIGKNIDFEV